MPPQKGEFQELLFLEYLMRDGYLQEDLLFVCDFSLQLRIKLQTKVFWIKLKILAKKLFMFSIDSATFQMLKIFAYNGTVFSLLHRTYDCFQ